jgi:hypothetical protein
MKDQKPRCRQCLKPLRRYRWRKEEWAKRAGYEWGDYGDGVFCGLRCGYRFACQAAGILPGNV